VRRVAGVNRVIECSPPLAPWLADAQRVPVARFAALQQESYDAIIDLQGLNNSALVARLARGTRFGLGNQTEGSSYEAPAGWLVDHAIRVEPHIHAMDRSRALAARAASRRKGRRSTA
jgi:heptosyltransferase-1